MRDFGEMKFRFGIQKRQIRYKKRNLSIGKANQTEKKAFFVRLRDTKDMGDFGEMKFSFGIQKK